MRLYLAGPMRGYPDFNFPQFRNYAAVLRYEGYEVVSPAEKDEEGGFKPDGTDGSDAVLADQEFSMEDAVRWDVEAIISCDAVVTMPGWEHSAGARAEVAIAGWLKKPVLSADALIQYGVES